jgi:hypothetical protein
MRFYLLRQHFNSDGTPKKALNMTGQGKAVRHDKNTYLCAICGAVHCGGSR